MTKISNRTKLNDEILEKHFEQILQFKISSMKPKTLWEPFLFDIGNSFWTKPNLKMNFIVNVIFYFLLTIFNKVQNSLQQMFILCLTFKLPNNYLSIKHFLKTMKI